MTLLGDRYTLVRRIGKGGFGDVWLARDEQLRRDVAVKILNVSDRSAATSTQKTERFRREAISMAKIEHPHVVAIYDVGAVPERQELFLVMELLEGRNLFEEVSTNGPLEASRCLKRFIEALEGLAAAHEVGVVHKDLKPANLFLHHVGTSREQMKLIDFGIARMESLTKLTGTGRMAGSPRYLAPEYIMGEEVTPAVDVYQMALIMVEALTGEPCIPRTLEFFDVCQRHVLNQLSIPANLEASPLGPVLRRALCRHPSDRYGSAREFADAIGEVDAALVPDSHGSPTVRMAAPDFDRTVPDDEPSVTAMIEELRVHEKAVDPTTNRYVGIVHAPPAMIERPAVVAPPLTPSPPAAPAPPTGARPRYTKLVAAVATLVFISALVVATVLRAPVAADETEGIEETSTPTAPEHHPTAELAQGADVGGDTDVAHDAGREATLPAIAD